MKKLLLGGIILIIIVGTGMAFLQSKKTKTDPSGTVKQTVSTNADNESVTVPKKITTGTSTIEGIIVWGKNLECSITYKPTGELSKPISGSLFTSTGNLRGDFVSPEMPEGSVASMIISNNLLYSWSIIEGESYGMKVDMNVLAKSKNESGVPQAKEPIDLSAVVNYECKPWLMLDPSIFIPPSDVLFKDFAQTIGSGMEYGDVYETGPGGEPCALCEKVSPGPGQDECKKNFKCQL